MNKEKEGVVKKFKALDKFVQKTIVIAFIFIFGIIIYIFYLAFSEDATEVVKEKENLLTSYSGAFDDEQLKSQIAIDRKIEEQAKKNDAQIQFLSKQNEDLQKQLENVIKQLNTLMIIGSPTSENTTQNPYPPSLYPETYDKNYDPMEKQWESFGGIRHINIEQTTPDAQNNKSSKNNYFPIGTMFKGTLINGLYAPTLTKGASSPHPAFIRIDDLSLLPNEIRRDIDGCRIYAEAYGEISDERVHMRLKKIACMANDGTAYVDDDIKGVVLGEDGTLGIPGELRASFNKLLFHTFLMEFLSGAGQTVKALAGTTIIGTDGTIQDVVEGSGAEKARKILTGAAGDGVSKGFDMIIEVYLEIIKQTTPVIQINGGRQVEIILSEGIELELQENITTWGDIL